MTKAQEVLKADIEKITDENTIEKVRIFIMGILAQQNIDEQPCKHQKLPRQPAQQNDIQGQMSMQNLM